MTVSDLHAIAAARNANLRRNDIEWAVGPAGLYMRDRADWTAHHTRELQVKAEQDRERWKHNHNTNGV